MMAYEDLNSLRLFVAVCETGSLAKAAERKFISRSALSKRMTDLEKSLNTLLFVRKQHGVVATAAGLALLAHARQILQSLAQLHTEVSDYGDGIRGHVRVLAIATSTAEFLIEELAAFLKENTYVRIGLEERVSAEVIHGVESGAADIGICRDFVATADLKVYPYGSDHLCVLVNAEHILAGRKQLSFQDCLEFEHVTLSINAAFHNLVNRFADDLGRQFRVRFNVSTFDAALRVVQSGLAISIVPFEAISRFSGLYNLVVIPLSETWAVQNFILCTKKAELSSPAARRLLEHLLARVNQKPQIEFTRAPR